MRSGRGTGAADRVSCVFHSIEEDSAVVHIHIYTSCLFRELAVAEIDDDHIRCLTGQIFQYENKWCMRWSDYKKYIDDNIEL